MKILYVIPYFYPATQFGGPVGQLWAQAKQMVKQGIDIRILTTSVGTDGAVSVGEWVECEGVKIFYASTGALGKYAPYYAPAAKREMQSIIPKMDIVHLHVSFTFLNYWANGICSLHGVPYTYSPHGCLCPTRLKERGMAKTLFKAFWERKVVEEAALRIALNSQEKENIGTYIGGKDLPSTIIPNGIVLDDLELGGSRRDEVVAKYGLPDDAIIMLFMARLHSIKGLDLLIESLELARQSNDRLHLILAGDDQGGKKIVETTASRLGLTDGFHFAGHVDGTEKGQLYESSDMFVLTSYSEGLPMGVLEACAYRLPCVLTKKCNVPEIAEFEAGYECDPDPSEIAAAFLEVAKSEEALATMKANARRCVEERFSMKSVIQSFMTCYADILKDKPTV